MTFLHVWVQAREDEPADWHMRGVANYTLFSHKDCSGRDKKKEVTGNLVRTQGSRRGEGVREKGKANMPRAEHRVWASRPAADLGLLLGVSSKPGGWKQNSEWPEPNPGTTGLHKVWENSSQSRVATHGKHWANESVRVLFISVIPVGSEKSKLLV